MGTVRILLNDIPPEGRHLVVDQASVWEDPLREFHMECRITQALRAELTLLPIEGGCLVRGTLMGAVTQPCDRCAEEAPFSLSHSIDTFEAIPGQGLDDLEDDADADMGEDAGHVFLEKNVPVLDVAGLCWEEFMLALPLRPLCRQDCKGLCASCGANLNEGSCACAQDDGDPRLAALRCLKVKKPE